MDDLLEQRLAKISPVAPSFSAALRACRRAAAAGDPGLADGLIAWLGGQAGVGRAIKSAAGITGHLDHEGALGFLQGLLTVLRDSGYEGLVVVLDEVETLQRMRSGSRDKSLNALRQLIDDIDAGRFPGLVLVATGTPAFFDGPQGVQRVPTRPIRPGASCLQSSIANRVLPAPPRAVSRMTDIGAARRSSPELPPSGPASESCRTPRSARSARGYPSALLVACRESPPRVAEVDLSGGAEVDLGREPAQALASAEMSESSRAKGGPR